MKSESEVGCCESQDVSASQHNSSSTSVSLSAPVYSRVLRALHVHLALWVPRWSLVSISRHGTNVARLEKRRVFLVRVV